MSCVGRPCNNAATSAVCVMQRRENDLSDPVFDGTGLAGFKSRVNAFLLFYNRKAQLCATERIIQSYLPLLVSSTPSLGSDASPPPATLTQLS